MRRLLVLVLVTCTLQGFSQSVYIEGLGRGFLYSVNYEHNLNDEVDGITIQLGAGFLPSSFIVVPLSVDYILGKNNHHFEVGGGLTYGGGGVWLDDDDFERKISLHGNLYYRYQKPGGKMFFKAGLTPFISDGFIVGPWIGLGVGFVLKK